MKILRSFVKISIVFVVTALCLILSVSYIVRKYFEEEVTRIIVEELNSVLQVRVDVKDINFSVFYSFPRASLDFRNVTIYSSPEFDASAFTEGDKVLFSKSISLRFNIIDLYYHRYDIKSIVLKDTYLWILKDTAGKENYRIWNQTSDSSGATLSVSLEKIVSENLFCWYDDSETKITGFLEEIAFAGQYKGGDLVAVAQVEGNMQSFATDDVKYVQQIPFSVSTNLLIKDTASHFTGTRLQSRNLSLMFDCILGYKDDLTYIINLKEGSTSFDAVKWFFPDTLFKDISAYQPAGDFVFGGKVQKNSAQKSGSAKFHIFSKNISAVYQAVQFNTSGLIYFDLPDFSDLTHFDIKTDAFKVSVDKSNWMQLSMTYKNRPGKCPAIIFDSQFACTESMLAAYLPETVGDFSGSFSGTSSGRLELCRFDTLPKLDNVRLSVDFFNIAAVYNTASVSKLSGRIELEKNKLQIPALQAKVNNSTLAASCVVHSVEPLLGSAEVPLRVTARLKADTLDFALLGVLQGSGSDSHKSGSTRADDMLDYKADLHIELGYLLLSPHVLRDVNTDLLLTPDTIKYALHRCTTSFGAVQSNGSYSQPHKTLDFTLGCHKLEISRVFAEFDDFGQSYLTREHVNGTVSGLFTGHVAFTDSMSVIRKHLRITSELTIDDGQLNNFTPLMAMSKYINEDELSSIRFSRISNIISIKNDSLFIPKMEINSSIADMTVSGEQSLDNSFDYKVQVILSKVMSARRKKRASADEQFGEIEDDGYGRTSLPLRIYGTADDFKVVYDKKAAKEVLKQKWQAQTLELKNILKEEFSRDQSPSPTDKSKDPVPDDFQFDWDD